MDVLAEQMYRENIMEHYKSPRNRGRVKNAEIVFSDNNPACGDEIEVTVKLNDKKEVIDVKFEGTGCAISQAATSMLTEKIKGMNLEEVRNIKKEEVLEMLGIPLQPIRVKCALLGFKVLEAGIFLYEGEKR
jgi:nitrogen fixation protein NifU and related proteins